MLDAVGSLGDWQQFAGSWNDLPLDAYMADGGRYRKRRHGVDYVLVLLIERRNIASGMTAIHALDGTPLGHFTLTDPFDAALVDDRRVVHGVTPVEPIDPREPAYRDVLVVTFAKK